MFLSKLTSLSSSKVYSIENLMLGLSKEQKFTGLILKTVTLVRFLKAKKYPETVMYKHLHGIEAGRASLTVQSNTPILLAFSVFRALSVPQY